MSYIETLTDGYGFFDIEALKNKGRALAKDYADARPFPHIAIDDFFPPAILETCLEHFPTEPDPDSRTFDRDQERYKTSFNPDYLAAPVRSFFYALNSRPFLVFLENMTGIKGLIPDPYFLGGGFHETKQGGHLNVHADFNLHPALKLERRLNLLIYLNRNWKPEYGGALELWDREMKNCVQEVTPVFNRIVVFSTTATSFHGHPKPVAHPVNETRKSLALYYYTSTWDKSKRKFTTQFKPRPATEDRFDWKVKRREIIDDLLPPILSRFFWRATGKLGRMFGRR
ncbi:MAG: 2OG-Fe(II) oxygenase [Parvularculaceae bacterium]